MHSAQGRWESTCWLPRPGGEGFFHSSTAGSLPPKVPCSPDSRTGEGQPHTQAGSGKHLKCPGRSTWDCALLKVKNLDLHCTPEHLRLPNTSSSGQQHERGHGDISVLPTTSLLFIKTESKLWKMAHPVGQVQLPKQMFERLCLP